MAPASDVNELNSLAARLEKLDANGRPIPGPNGKPMTEEQEVSVPAFKVVSVFDVSQTEGRKTPDIAVDKLTGSVERYQDFFSALERTSPVPIAFENIEGGAHGYCHLEEKRIAIDGGMSGLQNLKTTVHEIDHATLHAIDKDATPEGISAELYGLMCAYEPEFMKDYANRKDQIGGTIREVFLHGE